MKNRISREMNEHGRGNFLYREITACEPRRLFLGCRKHTDLNDHVDNVSESPKSISQAPSAVFFNATNKRGFLGGVWFFLFCAFFSHGIITV